MSQQTSSQLIHVGHVSLSIANAGYLHASMLRWAELWRFSEVVWRWRWLLTNLGVNKNFGRRSES
jgi:hypothetical protein